ncbi:HNH endonuclease signature motif containing protein [Tsukamurella tyrosinosolvens]|uniref:HNH endonuclease signature motif containing protein n=1 Tax=Tsukamurella tyrosinosolvens TaxID=57704 RepID=UPI00079402CE|nr:HNH endonuclease signature motif containing protein [Tsukamurella tyrosinosolvens]KXO99673.1 hypothetical protein AXK58_00120 [Tsukamurella tyrosinosolvens]
MPTRAVAHAGTDSRWRRLSLKARKLQPFCIDCRTTRNLTADHLLPVSEFPELAYEIENLTVRCRSCNSIRGTTWTTADAEEVLSRLLRAQKHARKVRYARLIPIAQRAAQGGGIPPSSSPNTCLGSRNHELFGNGYHFDREIR